MPTSTDINLPRDQDPLWPDRCVCCRAAEPNHKTKVWTLAIGWWTILLLSFGSIFLTRVPACPGCARKMQFQRALRWIVCIAICCVGVAITIWLLRNYTGPARVYLATGIASISIIPFVIWESIFPPAFDMTCYKKSVDYEFKDPMYAMEFEMLNIQIDEDDDE